MKKTLLTSIICMLVFAQSQAQTLIHYWDFNNPAYTTAVYHNPGIPAFKADYSAIDTNKALFVYNLVPGTSSAYAGYIDFVAVSATSPDYDSLNLRPINGVATPSGNAIRFRNPSDSAYLTFKIPTTGYKNITLKFAIETSNTTASPTNQAFAYSTDSGATWKTTSLSATTDTVTPVFSLITITFGADSAVNNNSKLLFKLTNTVRITAGGNVRFDNISVDGTLIPTGTTGAPTLVHYWNFNNFTGSYHNTTPTVGSPVIKADWSAIDTNKAELVYKVVPGTSSAYLGYFDYFTAIAGDSDVLNARTINGVLTPSGNVFRFRNPSDSAYLLFYIPSTGYKNLTFSYAVQSSSTASGMHLNNFSYSLDSGATWKTNTGLDRYQDSTISLGAYATTVCVYKLITVNITDTNAYNNPRLVFKIVPSTPVGLGKDTGTSGNNRFDNVTLDGVAIGNSHVAVPTVAAPQAHTPVAYPNPAHTELYINTFTTTEKTVVIYNIAGQAVYQTVANAQTLNVPIAALKTGMYYVLVHDNATGENTTTKFVKN